MLLRVISLVNLFALHEVVMSNKKKKVGKSCDLGVFFFFFFLGGVLIHVILELMLHYYFFEGWIGVESED